MRNNSGSPNPQLDLRGFGAAGDQNTLVLLDGQRISENEQTTGPACRRSRSTPSSASKSCPVPAPCSTAAAPQAAPSTSSRRSPARASARPPWD
ncbi:MAG: hypothetical protein MZW92_64510 [Comamonadaceae bacterium]|nr:hypothetical protein [Comamonadaceae bacterium]